ncbi:MAG: hypothetical protein WDO56_22745 [Gammaproteobacteria bacterium]
MKIVPAEIERKIDQAVHAWESSCPEQSFADMTLEQFKQALQPCQTAKAKFTAAEAVWETSRQERNAVYLRALELTRSVGNSVKGHPKYGENSAVYAAMGYVPKSERSSGLTRKREVETAKASAEAS